MHILRMKPGRERSLLRRHPWVFASALDFSSCNETDIRPGETVVLFDQRGKFLAHGAYNPRSQIRVRVWSFNPDEGINCDFFASRIENAVRLRASLPGLSHTSAKRMIHGESDGLPGLIVDAYDRFLIVQFLSAGIEFWREEIIKILAGLSDYVGAYERSDVDIRGLEGLSLQSGSLFGIEPPELIEIQEFDRKYLVNVRQGQKTGFYLDQRCNREILSGYTDEKRVLDCFCYTGGFSVAALTGGARCVVAVDESEDALRLGELNLQANRLDSHNVEWIKGDVFNVLRKFRDRGEKFDLIVLDPPKFAPTVAQIQRALRGYKDINLLAMKLLNPEGFLFTFSCSGGVSVELFLKVVSGAGLDAGVSGKVLGRLHQDSDHPVSLNFPEGNYLKGLILSV